MKHLVLKKQTGPDDRIVSFREMNREEQQLPQLLFKTIVTTKALKETFGDTGGWDLKCRQNCVSDCSCVSDNPCYLLIA